MTTKVTIKAEIHATGKVVAVDVIDLASVVKEGVIADQADIVQTIVLNAGEETEVYVHDTQCINISEQDKEPVPD